MKKIVYTILLILWMIFIFMLSNQNGTVSAENSSSILNTLLNLINIENTDYVISIIHEPLREFMHYFEYLILTFLLYKTLINWNIKKEVLIFLILPIIYALMDEIHQLFIVGRTFQLYDILMDILGCITVILIILINKKNKLINNYNK